MADKKLSTVVGGSAPVPVTTTIGTYATVSAGASGTIITIPAVANQRAVLTNLFVVGSVQETGITVNVGATAVISGGTLDDNNAARVTGTFCVGNRGSAADEPPVYSDAGEDITIVKDTGSTVNTIAYSYKYVK